jgi:preprotein translocase subunit SecF
MEFFKANTKIGFMRQRRIAAIFSIVLFACSIASLCVYGLTLGLDFTGGTQIEVNFAQPIHVQQLRVSLRKVGFKHAVVQTYTLKDISIRLGQQKISQAQIRTNIMKAVNMVGTGKVGQLEYIGAQVGQSLLTSGILAIIVSLLATMIYIALRFDWRFAISGAVALIHDPILILGVFSFFHLEFNLIVLAGLLTVIGYSLNDTVVVYDRVRENFRKLRKTPPIEVMDLSINQTLSRTIMTSGLTLLVVIALFLYGGEMIHNFSLALIIGIVIGTYSSIYVAGSMAIKLGLNREALVINTKKLIDEAP